MITAVLFDLDGTLVQTEELKAQSYAEAARELDPKIESAAVIAAFDQLAGRSREAVARGLAERFRLPGSWESFVALRLRHYDAMLSDASLLRRQALPAAIALLARVKREKYRIGLTTMSDCAHATTILDALGIRDVFEAIITPDDVKNGKPAPDMYLAVSGRLGRSPAECVAVEDSVAGITAAVLAGVPCLAVPTYLTRDAVHRAALVDDRWTVDDPAMLDQTFDARIAASR